MVFPKAAYAVDIGEVWRFGDKNPNAVPEFSTLGGLVTYFLPKVLLVAGIIFFILIVLAGFGMIQSAGSGDAHAQEKAKAYLTYAVIGLIIIFGAFGILQIINYVTSGSLQGIIQ